MYSVQVTFKFKQHSQGHLQQVSELKRSRSLGYVTPANHPAPFDNRVVAGSLPQYEKVVHKEKTDLTKHILAWNTGRPGLYLAFILIKSSLHKQASPILEERELGR